MIKLNPVKQLPSFCGPASLKMVLDYYGIKKTQKELGKISGCKEPVGVGADGLVYAIKQVGLEGFYYDKATLGELKKYIKKGIPPIVNWFQPDEKDPDGHYSPVVDITDEYVYLMDSDPDIVGIRKFRIEAFMRVWFSFPKNIIRKKNEMILRRVIIAMPPKRIRK